LDRGRAGYTAGQRLDVPQRGLGVEISEGREPFQGRLSGEPGVVAGDPRDRREQRSVEELLVEPTHLPTVMAPLLLQLLHRLLEVAQRAPQPLLRELVVRYDVGAAQLEQLDPVLQLAQERVGVVQRLTVS